MSQSSATMPIDVVAHRFRQFAEREAQALLSPLYSRLCRGIATDAEVLALAATAQPGQPVPNLLLGTVHYLLLRGVQHPLAAFYPSLTHTPDQMHDPYPAFRRFCLEESEAICELVATRRVQTNEIGRCACLLPAFELIAQEEQRAPLSLIEVGASAGLNLLWDRYGYRYENGQTCGRADSPVQITCAVSGKNALPLPTILPAVATRVGLDIHPIDLSDPDAVLWLRALIWPEHLERAERLQKAREIAQLEPPPVLAGDALTLLPEVVAQAPAQSVLCIFHSFTLNQFSAEQRERFSALLAQMSSRRTIYRISCEARTRDQVPRLDLIRYTNGAVTNNRLARCAPHGSWIEWLAETS